MNFCTHKNLEKIERTKKRKIKYNIKLNKANKSKI